MKFRETNGLRKWNKENRRPRSNRKLEFIRRERQRRIYSGEVEAHDADGVTTLKDVQ